MSKRLINSALRRFSSSNLPFLAEFRLRWRGRWGRDRGGGWRRSGSGAVGGGWEGSCEKSMGRRGNISA